MNEIYYTTSRPSLDVMAKGSNAKILKLARRDQCLLRGTGARVRRILVFSFFGPILASTAGCVKVPSCTGWLSDRPDTTKMRRAGGAKRSAPVGTTAVADQAAAGSDVRDASSVEPRSGSKRRRGGSEASVEAPAKNEDSAATSSSRSWSLRRCPFCRPPRALSACPFLSLMRCGQPRTLLAATAAHGRSEG